ncbi:MAG: alpha/beta hydrolase [Candidatus Omnitrophota bacterium]
MFIFKILNHIVLLFLFLGLVVIYFRYIEKRSLFYPAKELELTPEQAGLNYEDVYFDSSGKVQLNGWFIPSKENRYTIIFCHGNAGNISHRIEKIIFFNKLGCNVFIFDYRGYGKSKGTPSENGFYSDALAAYNYLLSRGIRSEQVIGYGESLGGAVIIDLASKDKMKAVIIDSVFPSTKDMARKIYPFLPYWLLASRFDSFKKIQSIQIPKLIIHSINDEIVPYQFGQKVYNAAAEPKEFLQVYGGHNSCFYDSAELFKEKISGFLDSL